jgi:hypothetical protein
VRSGGIPDRAGSAGRSTISPDLLQVATSKEVWQGDLKGKAERQKNGGGDRMSLTVRDRRIAGERRRRGSGCSQVDGFWRGR